MVTVNNQTEVRPQFDALSSRSLPPGTGTSPGQTSEQSARSLSDLGLGAGLSAPRGAPEAVCEPPSLCSKDTKARTAPP